MLDILPDEIPFLFCTYFLNAFLEIKVVHTTRMAFFFHIELHALLQPWSRHTHFTGRQTKPQRSKSDLRSFSMKAKPGKAAVLSHLNLLGSPVFLYWHTENKITSHSTCQAALKR